MLYLKIKNIEIKDLGNHKPEELQIVEGGQVLKIVENKDSFMNHLYPYKVTIKPLKEPKTEYQYTHTGIY